MVYVVYGFKLLLVAFLLADGLALAPSFHKAPPSAQAKVEISK